MASISDLPIEVLLKIFEFYMQTESQKNFLNTLCKVCKAWNDICFDSSLWKKYDGTPHFKTLIYLSKKGTLRHTKELILSPIDSLNSSTEKKEQRVVNTVENAKKIKRSLPNSLKSLLNETELFQNVPNVEIISFSEVKQISNKTLSIVAQNCPKLREIKIGKRRSKIMTALNYEILSDLLSVRGCGIKKIDISFCVMPSFSTCIHCIADCCPNLEDLYLENVDSQRGFFPTDYVQKRCSKLRALHMDCSIIISELRHPAGFPELEDFVYTDYERGLICDSMFESVVFNSPKLKFLSLIDCNISASAMLSLPASSVEYLFIPNSKACRDESLGDVLKKWSHSLKEVDLSCSNYYVNRALLKLIQTPVESPLEYLNLNFSSVLPHLVEDIVKNCSHLETLKLKKCKSLLRGMKKIYCGELDFQELNRRISYFRAKYPHDVFPINDS